MQVAFYTPLNDPDGGPPSGDRLIARMLMTALEQSGHRLLRPVRLRSYDGKGDGERQQRLARIAERLAARYLHHCRTLGRSDIPDLWLTYHLYHKAPDHIGPAVAAGLGIPYVVVEASYAGKQARGPWAFGHAAVARALAAADLVCGLNSQDRAGVEPLLKPAARYRPVKPFIDCAALQQAGKDRDAARARLLAITGAPSETPLLLAVGMMRPGAKLASYRLLAAALGALADRPWRLLVVGDGEAESEVHAAFAPLSDRVKFIGRRQGSDLARIYAGADLLVWPGIKEALGMVYLEAQTAGTPVLGARSLGIPDVVDDGVSGRLVRPDDVTALAEALRMMIADRAGLARMGAAAARYAAAEHDLATAGRRFAKLLDGTAAEHRDRREAHGTT